MKKFLLILSLVANAALAAVLMIRYSGADAGKAAPAKAAAVPVVAALPPLTAAEAAALGLSVAEANALRQIWPSLKTDDLASLVARLRAEGFSPEMVRAIITALVNDRFRARWKELNASYTDGPYWKNPNYRDPKLRAAQRATNDDYVKTLKDLLGPDASADNIEMQRRQFGNLSPEKISKIQEVFHDYSDLKQEVYTAAMGTSGGNRIILLPEDREKLAYLDKQQQADLAKTLTPDEFEDYQLRNSNTANTLRNQLAGFNPTEDEFRAIFQLQKPIDDQFGSNFGPISPDQMQAYQAAEKQLQAQVESTLSPDRAAEYKLATDPQYSTVSRLVARLDLPSSTTTQVVAVQQDIQQRASAIRADSSLAPADRTAQLSALSQEANDKLSTALGGQSGLDAYKQYGGQWLQTLQPRRRAAPKG